MVVECRRVGRVLALAAGAAGAASAMSALRACGRWTSLALVAPLALLAVVAPTGLRAGTTGKISGQLLDKTKKPIAYATIAVVGQKLGAFSDAQGNFTVLNIAPGSYDVSISRLGLKMLTVKNVVVSSDNTTRVDATLEEATLQTEEVVVTAQRPPVDVSLTSSKTTLSSADIQALPVQELQDVVNLQAGVVEGHFRGGREGEVQYQVDGVSVNNAYDNKSSLRLDRSLLQEVQVISGTFDAEYGQAMSGVVNAVLKQGTEKFQYSGELFGGGYVFPGSDGRHVTDQFQPTNIQNYQLNISGPLPASQTVYLLSARRYVLDDYVQATRVFVPTDSSNFEQKEFHPTGDGKLLALGYSREWSGVAKVTNSSLPNVKISYQAIVDDVDGRRGNWAFRFNPDGMTKQHNFSIVHGLDWTHTLSKSTFYNVSLRQNYVRYHDWAYKDVKAAAYDAAGPPIADDNYTVGAFIQGVDFGRFEQQTRTYLFNGSIVSQLTQEHQIKAGGELQLPKVSFGTPGYLVYTTVAGRQTLVRHFDDPPDFPGVQTYQPEIAALYFQDQMEFKDLTVRAGLRMEYFDARANLPSDLANPANALRGVPESLPKGTSVKTSFAPRLGVAFPITDRIAVHLAYGHFYQFPSISDIFSNANYGKLVNLQAGDAVDKYGVLGNPDVRPEQTVQYELGYKHALTDQFGVDLTVFYKDIRDLLGTEFISTYTGAEYARLTNVDFGNVIGFTVTADHRAVGPASIALDYTWEYAQGNSSDPRETATRASAGEDPRPRLIPFSWDQRHTFNMTVAFSKPDVYSASTVLRVSSGQPYTPVLASGFGFGLESNSGRKPLGLVIDLRAERSVKMQGLSLSAFGRVFNVLDARYFKGDVFSSTGSPYYSRFPVTDQVALRDPTRFYAARRIEIGIRLNSGL